MTKIEWTEQTWNPIVGCTVTSPGCTNCYAMKMAVRLANNPRTPQYHGTIKPSKKGPVWTGKIGFSDSVLLQPLSRKKPTTYFVNSMGDLFHPNVPDEWIDKVFAIMALCPQHTFQVLTKQADRMRDYMNVMNYYALSETDVWRDIDYRVTCEDDPYAPQGTHDKTARLEDALDTASRALESNTPLPNVWLGVSVEDQTRADERIPYLLNTPAAIRFVSAEPLLKVVDLTRINQENMVMINALTGEAGWPVPHVVDGPKLDWVIVGGESGHKARPMHPDWARGIRDQCEAAGVPFMFKQWGEWVSNINRDRDDPDWRANYGMVNRYPHKWAILNHEGGTGFHGDRVHLMKRIGKKTAGRLLDSREWNQMPEVG